MIFLKKLLLSILIIVKHQSNRFEVATIHVYFLKKILTKLIKIKIMMKKIDYSKINGLLSWVET